MAHFVFIYRHGIERFGKLTPEEMQQQMQKWHTWINEGLEQGWMVDPGDGLKKEGCVVNSKKIVTDGPFAEAKEIVGGFTVVQADGLDTAAEIAKGCPCLFTDGKVEIRPLQGYTLQMGNRPRSNHESE